tara:strand:- start:873 stop:977 length:105 start_codon:yes stop_codon:yes gene_type:complete
MKEETVILKFSFRLNYKLVVDAKKPFIGTSACSL